MSSAESNPHNINSRILSVRNSPGDVKKSTRKSLMTSLDSKKRDMNNPQTIKRRRGRPPKKMPIDTHTMVISPQLCKACSSEEVHYGSFESTPINLPETKVTPVASDVSNADKLITNGLEHNNYDPSSCSPANAIQQSPNKIYQQETVYNSNHATPIITTTPCSMWNTHMSSSANSQMWDYDGRIESSVPDGNSYGTDLSIDRSPDTSTPMNYESGNMRYVAKEYPTEMIPDYGTSNNSQYWNEIFSNVDLAAPNLVASSDTVSPLSVSASSSEYESVDTRYLNFCESYDATNMFGTEEFLQKKQLKEASQLWLA